MPVPRGLPVHAGLAVGGGLSAVVAWWAIRRDAAAFAPVGHLSGWILLAILVALTALSWRHRLATYPLGAVVTWSRLHLHLGWLSLVLYVFHTGRPFPGGWLTGALAALFYALALSGLAAWGLNRTLPQRLARREIEVLYERIPGLRADLLKSADALAVEALTSAVSTTLPDFYLARLRPFLERPRDHWRHLVNSAGSLPGLRRELADLDRYLDPRESALRQRLETLLRQKEDLDCHRALQWALRVAGGIHQFLGSLLWLLVSWHLVLVFAFGGGRG
ncbi:MAG: hypothetical protein HQL57_10335 [Magnetococcales bacterium]|nr:hypothetical protein [Magnetococcales bacterium]